MRKHSAYEVATEGGQRAARKGLRSEGCIGSTFAHQMGLITMGVAGSRCSCLLMLPQATPF